MAAGDMTDLATVGAWLQMQSAQYSADPILPGLISDCSAAFVNETNGGFQLQATATEKYDGNGQDFLVLRRYPVTAVSAVSINAIAQLLSPDGVQRGYVIDAYSVALIGCRFWRGRQNVSVAYTAGYASGSIPGEVRRAVTKWVAHLYRGLAHEGERSKHFEQGQSTTYDISAMPKFVSLVAENYKKRGMGGYL